MQPAIAAAAAVKGLANNVLEPGPCRPSKFLLEVDTQYSPAGILSSFIARQAEQPGSRNSNPAFFKITSNPSLMACSSTCLEPGTIKACTFAAFVFPFTNAATERMSSILELVQLPIKT